MLLSLKTGKKCLRVLIELKGRAKQSAKPEVEGIYTRLKKPLNKHAIYRHKTRNGMYIWWDTPQTVLQDKGVSKGNDRKHWKVGLKYLESTFGGYGFLDTYNSKPSYHRVYNTRNKWSFWHAKISPGRWEDARLGEVTVRCVYIHI